MRVVFAHDHRFISADGAVYTEGQFTAGLWARYLPHLGSLTVAARSRDLESGQAATALERSSTANVDFKFFPDISNLRGLLVDRRRWAGEMDAVVRQHDAVIARLPSEIGLMAVASARRAGRPWAVEVVGCSWDGLWNYGSASGRLYAPVAFERMRRAVRAAPFVMYVTESFLQSRYPAPSAVAAGVSNVALSKAADEVMARRRARIADARHRTLVLGLIGSLRHRSKGIQTLLAALAEARDALGPVELRVLGGGDPRPWREEAASRGVGDIVKFVGRLPPGRPVLDWLDEIDIYLQPSLQEGLPRALIEAMSRGCPAIASTVAGIPELLPREDLIVPGSTRQLAALLRRRTRDTGWMAQSAERNHLKAQEFRAEFLDARRDAFWARFADYARAGRIQADPLAPSR